MKHNHSLSGLQSREMRRPFPGFFKDGQPNLVVCNNGKVSIIRMSIFVERCIYQ